MSGGTPARIKDVVHGGTIVILIVRTAKGLRSIVFDHRPFAYWFEDAANTLDLCGLHSLIGLWVRFNGEYITLPYRTPGELAAHTAA